MPRFSSDPKIDIWDIYPVLAKAAAKKLLTKNQAALKAELGLSLF
jgi:hypothetical protein